MRSPTNMPRNSDNHAAQYTKQKERLSKARFASSLIFYGTDVQGLWSVNGLHGNNQISGGAQHVLWKLEECKEGIADHLTGTRKIDSRSFRWVEGISWQQLTSVGTDRKWMETRGSCESKNLPVRAGRSLLAQQYHGINREGALRGNPRSQ